MERSTDAYRIEVVTTVSIEELTSLYNSVGWTAYTKDITKLQRAIQGSNFVVTVTKQEKDTTLLIGLARAISDDASIAYIQDILVHPDHQSKGIGRRLVQSILERYSHVRQKVLLTDDRPEQISFYQSLGFSNTRTLCSTPLNAFVMIDGVKLS